MNIIGISAFYHEAAACLLRDGHLVAAAEEERFSRVKHDPRLPVAAFRYCLDAAGLDITDVDCVAYYESPQKKLERQRWSGHDGDASRPEREIRETLGYQGRIEMFEHHASHAASAFFCSGFPDAALMTVDGVGEWATATYGVARGPQLELFEEVRFPHSLGLLYSTITAYLGFRVNDGEYKVMGLAPYGQPRFLDQMRTLIRSSAGGQFTLTMEYFDFVGAQRMFSNRLGQLLGAPARNYDEEITQHHKDIARSLQVTLEELLLEKARYLKARVNSENLCMAGGVALNCVANGRILREGGFRRLFVQPAAGDSGGAVGAAMLAHARLAGQAPGGELRSAALGPAYSERAIAALLESAGIEGRDFRGREQELVEAVTGRLARGSVVGWFQGRMEFGPRALGSRSILADPRDPQVRERLNRLVKKREAFRPFAPSVLAEHAAAHFDLDHGSPFMLETCAVRSPLALPAVTHVDGSARPQTVDRAELPRFAALLDAFYRRTGCPLLVNTSFNVAGEPIVCSPADALRTMVAANLDSLALGDFLIDREILGDGLRAMISATTPAGGEAITSVVYTFL